MIEARIHRIPDCDICTAQGHEGVPAEFDATTIQGPWAYLCRSCMNAYHRGGEENLGVGIGQRLIKVPTPAERIMAGE